MKVRSAIAAVVVAASATGCTATGTPGIPAAAAGSPTRGTVAYAVDGDTLRVHLSTGELTYVRLVGIDTPEDVRPGYPTECGAGAAAASMERLAPEGAAVTLKPDSAAESEDRYGRILAHAFIAGRQLEIAQLRRGWAEVYRYEGQNFDGLRRFEVAQRSARRASRGVWGQCSGDFHYAARPAPASRRSSVLRTLYSHARRARPPTCLPWARASGNFSSEPSSC
jgi:micrococcal nuclease